VATSVMNVVFSVVDKYRSQFYRVMFILVGVVLMGVDRRGVFVGVCFRVFCLYMAPLVCTFCNIGLCSSCAKTWLLIKFC